jgi:hypothetical protein
VTLAAIGRVEGSSAATRQALPAVVVPFIVGRIEEDASKR